MLNKRIKKGPIENTFHVVCVGASAGGLEALTSLFKELPKKINMAFVLIQHLEPQHKSALVEILSRETLLNICEAKNNIRIKPSHIYVIPPNTLIAYSRGRLKVTARINRIDGRYLPIDFFMNSLAQDEKENVVGVILSGTGSDGTQGAKVVRARGGIIFAQDEKTARYYGMPGSAIASKSVNFVLPPEEIAKKLIKMSTDRFAQPKKRVKSDLVPGDGLSAILILLRDNVGVDFMHYKQTTISRRIARRMAFHNIKKHSEYYAYIKKNPFEINVLFKDLLISVTSFFRDPAVFSMLRKSVFPVIASDCSFMNPIRVWVPACSSGEEVYSYAIALYEFLEERNIKPFIKIFGTDVSEVHIEKARSGLYGENISEHFSSIQLRRFFTKTETGYRIAKNVRDLCIFAKHDITTDPPLPHMDIVSCRNFLIYLDTFLQNKVLSILHYALKQTGFLILGASESISAAPELFIIVDKKNKIYSNAKLEKRILSAKRKSVGVLKAANAAPSVIKSSIIAKPKKMHIKKPYVSNVTRTTEVNSSSKVNDFAKLKKAFALTHQRLNVIIEEKDTFNEELKAANEETQSSNEELQSMNEELETSKEELQSTNEELITLNDELQNKNIELTHLNSDLSNVFSSTNIPIIIVGNDLCIKRFTPTARKVMNLIPGDLNRPISDIKLKIEVENLEEMILGVCENMAPKEWEVKDQEGRWYSMRIRPYRTIDNKIDGAVIAMIDIDFIKRSREELLQACNKLKDTQMQLMQSNKMSALGQLAGGVAHELNNPLTGVLNNVQLVKMEAELKTNFNLDDFKDLLNIIEESALRCKKITQSLLDFTHVGNDIFKPVSINDLVNKTVDLIGHELNLQNIVFNYEVQPDLPLVQGDFQLLQQVFYGIFVNAKWAIEKKSKDGGTITIKTAQNTANRVINISIFDTGIGIAPENIPKIFTPYFTTKEVGEGVGLGLALFYNIIKTHGGDMKIESQAGIGTTVLIILPY